MAGESLGTAVLELDADASKLDRKLDAEEARVSGRIASMSAKMKTAGASMVSAGRGLTRGLTLPIIAAGTAVGKLAYDFDKSMGQIASLVGASDKQMGQYRKAVLDMAKETGKAPRELADALYFITSSGFKGAAALDVLRISAKASAAGLGSTKTVADAVTSAINAYGGANLSATKATDILVAAVREGKAEPEALAAAIGRVIAPAQAMGVEFHEVAGAVAALSMVGLDAAEATTALRGTLMAILKPTQDTRKFLAANGESLAAIRTELREKGLLETLTRLSEKFKGNQDAIGTLFPNVRALNGVLALTGENAGKTAKVMGAVAKATGDTSRAFAERQKQDSFKIQQAWATIQASLIRAGSDALPILARAAATLAGVIETLTGAFDRLSPGGQKLVLFGIVAVAALGPVIVLVGRLTQAIGFLGGAGALLVRSPWIGALVLLGATVAIIATKFDIASAASRRLAEEMDAQRQAAEKLRGVLQTLEQSNLALQQAQQNIRTTSLGVEAAEKTYAEAVKQSGKASLQTRQALDALNQARLSHKQAILDEQRAQEQNTAAHQKADAQVRGMLGTLTALSKDLDTIQKWRGNADATRLWGMEMQKAGQIAYRESFNIKGLSPAAQLAQRSFATMQIVAGSLARELGRMPTKKEIVARAKLEGGPAFMDGLKGFVKAAEQAGIQVPKWIRDAVKPTSAAAGKVVAAVSGKSGDMFGAGKALGVSAMLGISTGIYAQMPSAVQAGLNAVANVIAAMRAAAGAHSPATMTVPLGQSLIEGVIYGIDTRIAVLRGRMSLITAEVTRLNGEINAVNRRREAEDRLAAVQAAEQQLADAKAMSQKTIKEQRERNRAILDAQRQLERAREDIDLAAKQKELDRATAQQARIQAQLDRALERQKAAVQKARDVMGAAYDIFADRVMRAFDAIRGAYKTPAEQALAAIQARRQQEDLADAVTEAEKRLAEARASGDQEEIAAAEKALARAREDITIASLEKTADAERKAYDQETQTLAQALSDRLAALKNHFAQEGATYSQAMQDILAILSEFGISFENAGRAVGDKFSGGAAHGVGAEGVYTGALSGVLSILSGSADDFQTVGETLGDQFAKGLLAAIERVAQRAAEVAAMVGRLAGTGTSGAVMGVGPRRPGVPRGIQQRATGGPVLPGRAYLVGERRMPEVFVPRVAGTILPSVQGLAGGRGGWPERIVLELEGRQIAEVVRSDFYTTDRQNDGLGWR